jgi:hypothetical protein
MGVRADNESMRLSRVRSPELLTGVCGLALLVDLFLPWFGAAAAWEAFTVLDLLLALVGAAAVALPVIYASNAKPDAPITATALTVLGGGLATLLVVFRLLDPVGEGGREVGLYLGLLASAGLTAAAWRAMADERS